jgi:hypothetical protein
MIEQFYAHSVPGKPPSEWQPLKEHLKNVAEVLFLQGVRDSAGRRQN